MAQGDGLVGPAGGALGLRGREQLADLPGLLSGHVEHVVGGVDPVHPPPLDGGQ